MIRGKFSVIYLFFKYKIYEDTLCSLSSYFFGFHQFLLWTGSPY